MLVCHCRGITDRKIRRQVRNGAVTARDVANATGAGSSCGGCRPAVMQVVRSAMASQIEDTPSSGTLLLDMALEA